VARQRHHSEEQIIDAYTATTKRGIERLDPHTEYATPAIRATLELRDGGCVFPGCTTPARDCDAHHIIPWWAGGPTSLWNLVVLCPHHHGTVEPSHNPDADRWKIRLREDGIAEIIPPLRVDPSQRPRLHARFHTR